MKRFSILLLITLLIQLLPAQDSLKTVASFDMSEFKSNFRMHWIPVGDDFVLFVKPINREMHFIQFDNAYHVKKEWQVLNVPYLKDFRYIGCTVSSGALSMYFLEAGKGNLFAYYYDFSKGSGVLKLHVLEDNYHEKSLIANDGATPGLLRFYKKGKTATLRYYRFNGGIDYQLISKPVDHKELAKALDKQPYWVYYANQWYATDAFNNAMLPLSISWEQEVLRLALDLPNQNKTLLYTADFKDEIPEHVQDFPFYKQDFTQPSVGSRILPHYFLRNAVDTRTGHFLCEIYDLESGDTLLIHKQARFASFEPDTNAHHVAFKVRVRPKVKEITDGDYFFDKLAKFKHPFISVAPNVDGNLNISLGTSTTDDRGNWLGNFFMSGPGGFLSSGLGWGLTKPIEMIWLDFIFNRQNKTLKLGSSAYDPIWRNDQAYFEQGRWVLNQNNDTRYYAIYNREEKVYEFKVEVKK